MDVTAAATIARSRQEVANYAADPANETAWIGGISESRPLEKGPLAIGSQVARVASFAGRRIDYVLEVTHLERGRVLAMRSVKAPFPMEVEYQFDDDGSGGTRMRVHIGGGGEGLLATMARPFVSAMVKRNISGDLKRLKRIMETSQR